MIPFSPRLIGLCAAFLCGGLASGYVVNGVKNSQIYQLQTEQAGARAAAEATARQQMEEAMRRGDALENRLNAAESVINKRNLELSRVIPQITTGRHCLDAVAVRVLNSSDGSSVTLPQATGGVDAENGGFATDSDVAWWVVTAQREYETCRNRVNALIDYASGAAVNE